MIHSNNKGEGRENKICIWVEIPRSTLYMDLSAFKMKDSERDLWLSQIYREGCI